MADLRFIVLALTVSLAAGVEFTCDMMRQDHLQQTRVGFQINTGSNIYQPGSQVQVRLGYLTSDRRDPFTFMIQAFKSGSTTETVGSWIPAGNDRTTQCDVTNMNSPDTLYIAEGVLSYTVTWQAPKGDKSGDAVDIEFFVIFIDADGNQHKLLSIGMSPAVEPSTLPPTEKPDGSLSAVVDEVEGAEELDLHKELTEDQMKMDAERKFIEEIDEENKATEDDWNKEELIEMRMRQEEEHEEEMEYERLLREEEEERLDRIRAEILDKEEHDRLMAEKQIQPEEGSVQRDILLPETIEVIEESTSGASHVVAGFTSCLLVTLIQKLI